MLKAVLFDLDGTLTDPKEGITKCVQYSLKHFGIEVDDLTQLMCFIGPPLVESFQQFYGFDKEKAEVAVAVTGIAGPTGGFILSFPIMAYIIGLASDTYHKRKYPLFVGIFVGTILNFCF